MFFRVVKPLMPLIPIGIAAVVMAIVGVGTFRRRRGMARRDAFASAALDVLLGASLLSIAILTLPPSIEGERSIEMIPFHGAFHTSTTTAETVANVLLFIPLGVFAPARWPILDRWWRVVASALGLSLLIEAAQFVFALGRQSSFTDVILNTTGAAVGYVLLRVMRAVRRGGGVG
jgi:hypothetical protein